MTYTLDNLKEEDWYKNLPAYVKEAVEKTPPVFLYRRKYHAGFWMVTGYTEDATPDLILQPVEMVTGTPIKTNAVIESPEAVDSVCWSCEERTSKEELIENKSWCEQCNLEYQ